MAKSKELNMKIPSVGDLFSTQEEREEVGRESVRDIPLEDIHEFPNHPFKVKMDEKMMEMVESVRQYGVLVPAIVRPKEEVLMKWLPDTEDEWQVNWPKKKICHVWYES